MSAVMGSYNHETDASYAADFGRDREPMKTRSRHPEYRRKGSAPTRVSGMHCRRNKRWTWGSGRGARMSNLRAFAGCLAVAVAAFASNAFAVSFDWANITGSNAAYTGNTNYGGPIGGVSYDYRVSKTETTRGQYAEFLNAVATSTSAPTYVQALYSGSTMGISRSVVGGAYSYSVVGNVNNPISSITWTSAARFVNWLNAGQVSTTNPAQLDSVLNNGAYTILASNTSSTVVTRNAGYTTPAGSPKFFLPSANEWVKAAFYNPLANSGTGGWNTWQYGSTQPTATSTVSSGSNVAVYATGVTSPSYAALPVGSLPNSKTAYGLYDMLGNVTEMTDTANGSGAWFAASGGFATAQANMDNLLNSWNINGSRYLTSISTANGFRVAGVAAVPEPETITLAAFGIVGLCGANWLKRRRKPAALPAPADETLAA